MLKAREEENDFFKFLHISSGVNYPDECTCNVSADAETSERTGGYSFYANLAFPRTAIGLSLSED